LLVVLALALVAVGCGSTATTTTTAAAATTTTAAAATTTTAAGAETTTTAAAATTTTAAAAATGKEQGKKIAIINAEGTNQATVDLRNQFLPIAKAAGLVIEENSDAAGDYTKLLGFVDNAIAQKVDAIWLPISADSQIQTALQHAKAANIPVFGGDVSDDPLFTHTTISDDQKIGAMMMEELAKRINYTGNIYMIKDDTYGIILQRHVGALSVLTKYPNIHDIQDYQGVPVNPIGRGHDIMQNILTSSPKKGSIAGLWSLQDEMAVGAAQACEAAGRTEIAIVGCDAAGVAMTEMKKPNSPMKATVAQDWFAQATASVKAMVEYFNGQPIPNRLESFPGQLVTQEMVQSGAWPTTSTT
jgi:ribose transport system substrate-binding protein